MSISPFAIAPLIIPRVYFKIIFFVFRVLTHAAQVLAFVKAYERLKKIGYSQAHVVEALNAYAGGAAGLTPQEEDRQHQRF